MAQQSAVCDFSLRSAGDSGQIPKKGDMADWSIAKQYMDLVSRGVRPAIVLESGAGTKLISRAEGSKSWSRPPCDNS